MSGIEVAIADGTTGVEVVLSLKGSGGAETMRPDQARELARRLVGAATAAERVSTERLLHRHRPALRFEV